MREYSQFALSVKDTVYIYATFTYCFRITRKPSTQWALLRKAMQSRLEVEEDPELVTRMACDSLTRVPRLFWAGQYSELRFRKHLSKNEEVIFCGVAVRGE